MAYKAVFKNTCTPQEKINFSTGYRWYLDSDCGRRLAGGVTLDLSNINTYTASVVVETTAVLVANGTQDFIMIKNLGGGTGSDMHISLNGSTGRYYIVLSSGEVFASKVKSDVTCYIKCLSGDTTAQFLEASI